MSAAYGVETGPYEGGFSTPQYFTFHSECLALNRAWLLASYGNFFATTGALPDQTGIIARIDKHEAKRKTSEVFLAALIDNFQAYLTEILSAIFTAKPETIYAGSVKNADVFNHPDIDSLRKSIIDRNVLALGYKRIDELDEFFREKFKLDLTATRFGAIRISRVIQVRNLISHNRGIVNKLFLARAGSKADRLDQPVRLPPLQATDRYLMAVARSFDRRAIHKFGLSTIEAPQSA